MTAFELFFFRHGIDLGSLLVGAGLTLLGAVTIFAIRSRRSR